MKLKPAYQNFEETFISLRDEAHKNPVSIHTFLTALSGRGKVLLLILLSLGFAQIPGVAVVLGLFITYLGARIALGRSFIWMPKYFRQKTISSFLLIKVIDQTLKMLKFLKRWSRPRYEKFTHNSSTLVINGLMIALVGICLAISPPVPLTGIVASMAILMIGIGLLNNDGVYLVIGYCFSITYLLVVQSLLQHFSFTQIYEYIYSLL